MSEVAGRMSIQEGAKFLETSANGPRDFARWRARRRACSHHNLWAAESSAQTQLRSRRVFRRTWRSLDVDLDRLRYLDDIMPANVNCLYSDRYTILEELQLADLVIGSVLIPGAKAPQLVRADDLQKMKNGSVVIDVAVDQGGCIETSRPTTHSDPTFIVDGVVHYCVANMPGAVGRTSTFALCNATLNWVIRLAELGNEATKLSSGPLRDALNVHQGKVTNEAVAAAFGI